jgi:DNA-binding transcriptional regulator YdaS (Cro superfamily)
MDKDLIRTAADKVGGIVALSVRLGITKSAVSQWERVPAEHVLRVESLTGVSRHVLRPDVFGLAPEPLGAKGAPPGPKAAGSQREAA